MIIKKLLSGAGIAILLAGLSFAGLVIFGIYTALDSATTGYAIAQEEEVVLDDEVNREGEQVDELMDIPAQPAEEEAVASTVQSETVASEESYSPASQSTQTQTSTHNHSQADAVSNASSSAPSSAATPTPTPPAASPEPVPEAPKFRTITEYFTVCNDCGFKVQGSIYPHQDVTGHTRYSTDVPFTSQVPA